MSADLLERMRALDPAATPTWRRARTCWRSCWRTCPAAPAPPPCARAPRGRAGGRRGRERSPSPAVPRPTSPRRRTRRPARRAVLYVRTRSESRRRCDDHRRAGSTATAGAPHRLRQGRMERHRAARRRLGALPQRLRPGRRHDRRRRPGRAVLARWAEQNFVAEFRRDYQRGTLDPAGTTTFAGKRAQRYVVDAARGRARGPEAEPARPGPGRCTASSSSTPTTAPRSARSASRPPRPRPARAAVPHGQTVEAIEHLPADAGEPGEAVS